MQEGLPNVVMEASACGRAVFGSNAGGIPEVIVNGETGLVLSAGDVTAWKNALTTYAIKPDELTRMGKGARQRAKAQFDTDNYAPQMLDLYDAAMREPLNSNLTRFRPRKEVHICDHNLRVMKASSLKKEK